MNATASESSVGTPTLDLKGFQGSLASLLERARAQQIDLATLSLPDMLDQLAAALRQAASLSQKADWVVMAAWLLHLRSRRLVPEDRETAAADAQALARWLGRQPRLGQDTFPRGQPELAGMSMAAAYEVDVIEFLWASLALYSVAEARARIRARLTAGPLPLNRLLPPAPRNAVGNDPAPKRRSAWTSTFTACLEMTKQGEITLEQENWRTDIHVRSAL
jgi:segregation and condensation protein A